MLKTHCVCCAIETDVRTSMFMLKTHCVSCTVETDVPACSCSKRTVSVVRFRLMYQHVHTASTCAVCCVAATDVPACSCSKRTVSLVCNCMARHNAHRDCSSHHGHQKAHQHVHARLLHQCWDVGGSRRSPDPKFNMLTLHNTQCVAVWCISSLM